MRWLESPGESSATEPVHDHQEHLVVTVSQRESAGRLRANDEALLPRLAA